MLSILIPTYNYNIAPLVKQLHAQALKAGIVFEIIVLDDASPNEEITLKNGEVNSFENCSYTVLSQNIGRSAIRNQLASEARYEWLLFLDADTLPVDTNLIRNYLQHLNNEEKVVYGGIRYTEQQPDASALLRWVYGNNREALTVEQRQKAPYLSLLTLNFAIKKSVFEKVKFNETIPNLRHEDTLFSYDLKKAGIRVEHIDNPVYHMGLESSTTFIHKSEQAVAGLKYLLDTNLLPKEYTKIGRLYYRLKRMRMQKLAATFFSATRQPLLNNFTSTHPSLWLFDLYRLSYLCSL